MKQQPAITGLFDQVTNPDHWPSPVGLVAGAAARDRGHKQADANADDIFTAAAWAALERVCRAQREVTSDDIWTNLDGRLVADKVPKQAMVIGSIIRTAAGKKGWLRSTGRVQRTNRAAGHARHILIWESRIYGGRT